MDKLSKPIVAIEDFQKLDIRIAKIAAVEIVEGADKLYKITLDVGELGERVVAAGMRPFYEPQDMVGKLVPYIANLEPRTIRGIVSHGMIMAAGKDIAVLLCADRDIIPGDIVR